MEAATETPESQSQAAPPPRMRERYNERGPACPDREVRLHDADEGAADLKVTVNMGVGEASRISGVMDDAVEELATITGQRPNIRRAKKSIAAFKIRDDMPVGCAVTLRGARMWEFLDRLVSIATPRIRDFRGYNPRSFDGRGNFNLGIREQIIFPEIDYDQVKETRGLDIAISTTTADTTRRPSSCCSRSASRSRRRAAPALPASRKRKPLRRRSARKRPASGPRPSRPRSSSSRRRTPRPTPSRSRPKRTRREPRTAAAKKKRGSGSPWRRLHSA